MLTLRIALGAAMYAVLIAVYGFLLYRWSARTVHLGPGQQIGWDVRSMIKNSDILRNPMFWIVFIVLASIGSTLLSVGKR